MENQEVSLAEKALVLGEELTKAEYIFRMCHEAVEVRNKGERLASLILINAAIDFSNTMAEIVKPFIEDLRKVLQEDVLNSDLLDKRLNSVYSVYNYIRIHVEKCHREIEDELNK